MRNPALIGALGAFVVRALIRTLRIRIDDRAGVSGTSEPRVIWSFWHNRLLLVPHIFFRYVETRKGSALTSASRDGDLLAAFIERFNVAAIRGSSSRRGAAAVLEMIDFIRSGYDVAITPDGPRGPRYKLSPGIIRLAQKTGAPILPLRIEYSRCVRLKSWDAFMIPLPFSRVDVTFGELLPVPPTQTEAEFEAKRAQIEQILQPDTP
jgi:lysophospholipid acyltransferase (LPLAT)-like uncharacterized protein